MKWPRTLKNPATPAGDAVGQRPHRAYRFIFIIGASGSGTTLLARILSTPDNALALGGNYTTIAEGEAGHGLMLAFNLATEQLWDPHAGQAAHAEARVRTSRVVNRLLALPALADKTHIIYKRSAPFFKGDRHRPDLSDIFELFDEPRVIVIYRDPLASTYSSLRRGFAENLRQMAVICEERLTYLAAQAATLASEQYRLIQYEDFCANPGQYAAGLAEFCGFPEETVRQAIAAAEVRPDRIDHWRAECSPEEVRFLTGFFSPRRMAQWANLQPKTESA